MIQFVVYGTPRPQGSMRNFMIQTPTGPHAVMTSANRKLKPWRQEIAQMAMLQREAPIPAHKAVSIRLMFFFLRPKSVKASKRPCMTVKPDTDKLVRAVFDSLKGVLYHDDAQVTHVFAHKFYGDPERVEIQLEEL